MICPGCGNEIKDSGKFCKYCGNTITPSKQVQELSTIEKKSEPLKKPLPGKLKAVFNKKHALSIVLAIICCSLVGAIFYQQIEFNAQKSEYENHITDMRNEINSLKKSLSTVRSENIRYKSKIDFFDNHVVFVTSTGEKYHKYDCHYFQDSKTSFWAYNTEAAKSLGYKACSECR